MRLNSLLFALALCLLTPACGKSVPTAPKFELPGNPGGRMCINQCRVAKDYCRENCALEQRRCMTDVQTQAMKDYDYYAQEQFQMHLPLDLRPSDFEKPEKCKPDSCYDSCESPYRSCFETCGGKIVATTSCQFFCF